MRSGPYLITTVVDLLGEIVRLLLCAHVVACSVIKNKNKTLHEIDDKTTGW